MGKRASAALLLAITLLCFPAQADQVPSEGPSITLGVISWIPAEPFRNRMAPLIQYLERTLDYPVRLVIVEDPQTFYSAVAARAFDLAYVDGCQAARMARLDGSRPLVEVEFPHPLRSLVIVNATSDLNEVSDLIGHPIRVSMSTKAIPVRLGLLAITASLEKRPDRNFELSVASDNGQVIFDIIEGRAQVGIIHNVALAVLAEPLRASVRVVARSEPIPNPYLISRVDLPATIADQIQEAYIGFAKDPMAAAYFTESPIQAFRKVEEKSFAEFIEFCERVEEATTPMLTPPPPADAS